MGVQRDPLHIGLRRRVCVAAAIVGAAAALAASAGPASASIDLYGAYGPGTTYLIDGTWTKEYITYTGSGSFLICAWAHNYLSGNWYGDCGYPNDSRPQARLLHCGANYADFYIQNGDNSTHHFDPVLYSNPC